jgi:hypothetical protein
LASETAAGASGVADVAQEVQRAAENLNALVGRFTVWNPGAEDRRARPRTHEEQGAWDAEDPAPG